MAMSIEEAEIIFGKRWNNWTEKEWEEYLPMIEEKDLRIPLLINMVMKFYTENKKEFLSKSVIYFIEDSIVRAKKAQANALLITTLERMFGIEGE